MERKDFLKSCSKILLKLGFQKKGTVHFYKDISEDVMIVVGLSHSKYDSLYWFDGGFVIKSINKHMPYPHFTEVNIRTMGISIGEKHYIDYLNIGENDFSVLENSIRTTLELYSSCCDKFILLEKIIIPDLYIYCTDYDLPEYFSYSFPDRKILPDISQI